MPAGRNAQVAQAGLGGRALLGGTAAAPPRSAGGRTAPPAEAERSLLLQLVVQQFVDSESRETLYPRVGKRARLHNFRLF